MDIWKKYGTRGKSGGNIGSLGKLSKSQQPRKSGTDGKFGELQNLGNMISFYTWEDGKSGGSLGHMRSLGEHGKSGTTREVWENKGILVEHVDFGKKWKSYPKLVLTEYSKKPGFSNKTPFIKGLILIKSNMLEFNVM